MTMIPVEQDVYENVLGEDLPDRIGAALDVDRRGYAPEIADVLGPDYMQQEAFIFAPEQADADLLSGGEVMDDVMDTVFSGNHTVEDTTYDTEPVIEIATDYGPIALDLQADLDRDGYRFSAVPQYGPGLDGLDTAIEQYQELTSLDQSMLTDREQVASLVEWAEQYRGQYDQFADLSVPDTLGSTTVYGANFDLEGCKGNISRSAITLEDTRFRLRDLDLSDRNVPFLQSAWKDVNGILDRPALIDTVNSQINLIAAPAISEPETVQDSLLDHTARIDTHRKQRGYNASSRMESKYSTASQLYRHRDAIETPLFGFARSTHEKINILTDGSVDVYPCNTDCTVYGTPPAEPDYTLLAHSETRDITVYHLSPTVVLQGDKESLMERLKRFHDTENY